MSNLKKSTLLVAASILTISGIALASPKADTNNDGQITRAEFQAAADAKFAKADTNFDGNLTKDEMRALRASNVQNMKLKSSSAKISMEMEP